MLLPRSVRIYVASEPVSLRKSFDGLMNHVRCVLGRDPLSGHVFVFVNRRKTMVKLLVWTRGGFTIVHKRLERGHFVFSRQVHSDARSIQIEEHELALLLEGIDVQKAHRSQRWEPPMHQKNSSGQDNIYT